MARGTQYQGNFLGGQWSLQAQGRLDHPWHASAMALSYNGMPIEGGAWTRRPGTRFNGPIYHRFVDHAVKNLSANTAHRYAVVLSGDGSNGYAHFFRNNTVLTDTATPAVSTSSSTGGVLSVVFASAPGWSVGDQVIFTAGLSGTGASYLNRWLQVRALSNSNKTIALGDDLGNVLGFDTGANAVAGATLQRIKRYSTGILTNLRRARIVPLGTVGPLDSGGFIEALILHPQYAPQVITFTLESATGPDTITVGTTSFVDGPYLDIQTDSASVSGTSGTITLTPVSTTFVSTDVGRLVRIFSEPAAWASGTTYTSGQLVKYNNAYWQWVGPGSISGVTPGTPYTTTSGVQQLVWAPAPTAGNWAWGTITAQATTSCTVVLQTSLNSANPTGACLWRLGVFGNTLGFPSSGIMFDGRLYLGGCVESHFDGSMSGFPLTFSPTDTNGNVFDDSALGLDIASPNLDQINWFLPDRSGLLIGTTSEEFLLNGGTAETPITPTNLSLRRVSSYGSLAFTNASSASFSHIFVQTFGKLLFEYVTDVFAASPSGRVLNEFSKSLAAQTGGMVDLDYTETPVPAIWTIMGNGSIGSTTYRRFSRFMTSPPEFAGGALHQIADGYRQATSIAVVSLALTGAQADLLYVTAVDPTGVVPAGLEQLTPPYESL